MFNEYQRHLLSAARERIEAGKDRFICCAINSEVEAVSEATYSLRWADARDMKEEIEFGLEGYSCLDLWLFSETGIYPDNLNSIARDVWKTYAMVGWKKQVSRGEFDNLCKMARLAWIDRALDRGKLA